MTQEENTASDSFWKRGASIAAAVRPSGSAALRQKVLLGLFTFEVLILCLFQKVAVPFGSGQVQAVLPLTYIFMGALFIYNRPKVDLTRAILFTTFLFVSLASIMLQNNTYSANSIILLVAIYLPFIFFVEVSSGTYRKLIEIYLKAMLIVGVVVLVQHAVQILWSWRLWPNLDLLIPDDYLFHGYVYIQDIVYGSRLMKPNAVFFLEVSYVSQFIAVAFALELVYFQRLWRLLLYAVILLSTFAGTGLMLLIVSAPILLGRVNLRTLAGVALIIAACIFIAVRINWYQQVENRFGEYDRQGTSANHRFVEPLEVLSVIVKRPDFIYTGSGPGNGDKQRNKFWWVTTKLAYEYGLLATLSFMAFFSYTLFKNSPSQRISIVLFIMYNIMSGFIIPVYPFLIFLLGGLFRIRPTEKT